jgi:hypothetical protein
MSHGEPLPNVKEVMQWFHPEPSRLSEVADQLLLDRAHQATLQAVEVGSYDPVRDMKLLLSTKICGRRIPGYTSVDHGHMEDILRITSSIKDYLSDKSLKRPRNFMILATPGSGKSHLIDCIGNNVGQESVGVIPFNMATMHSRDDLTSTLDLARNMVVDGKLPVIFLDEFDTKAGEHFPLLLPLLWDGTLHTGSRELRVGRCIIFLAGSNRDLPDQLAEARTCRPPKDGGESRGKELDLLSRINGSVVRVPKLADSDRGVSQRVLLAVALMRKRFPKCVKVPLGLLRFVAKVHFRYDARSVATFIDFIPKPSAQSRHASPTSSDVSKDVEEIRSEDLRQLPLAQTRQLKTSPLALHLWHEDELEGLVDQWNDAMIVDSPQHIYHSELENLFDDLLWESAISNMVNACVAFEVPGATQTPPV